MPPAIAALAPVVASGVGSIIKHKQAGSAAKQAEEQRRLEAQKADEQAKLAWEAQQSSPAAQAARYKNTLALGRLAGAMGGLDKLPPSIRNYYQTQRTMPAYTGTSSYIPTPKKGGGVWDFLGGVTEALPYLDTSAFSKSKAPLPTMGQTPPIAGSAGFTVPQIDTTLQSPLAGLTQRLKPRG